MKRFFSAVLSIFVILASVSLNTGTVFAASAAPPASNIIITNNLTGKSDTIYIFGLDSGSLVKVYDSKTGNKVLAYGTVSRSKVDIKFTIPQLGVEAGSVYISVIEKGNTESSRTQADYEGEPKSKEILDKSVTITNNAQKSDTVYVSGLNPRDVVKVYNAASGGKLLGSKTVSTTGSDVTITISQIGSTKGSLYVTVTNKGMLESGRVPVEYEAEPASAGISPDYITVNNNAKSADTIYIYGLSGGDVVKAYNSSGKLLGSKAVSSSGYEATITVSQLGIGSGYVYITVTSTGYAESAKTEVFYEAELASVKPTSEYITVTNNSGKSDTVYVTGLSPNDIVKVYTDSIKGSLLGTATVPSGGNDVTISIPQLGLSNGVVYVSVTNQGRNESLRTQVSYPGEGQSSNIPPENITVTNNVGKADTIYVSNLNGGDVVKVYDAGAGGNLLGSSTVAAAGTDVTVSITQLGVSGGTVYVSVRNSGKSESGRVSASYPGESKSNAPDVNSITISNNAGASDTIYVTGLSAGSVVKVYSAPASGYLLGSATVPASGNDATVTISQLGTAAGSVYVTFTQPGMQESGRTKVDYSAEGTSTAPNVNNISITNNVGKADTVYVSKLTTGDIVRIYSAATQGSLLGTATVPASASDVTVSISQLGAAAGSIYISVTSTGMAESLRTKADYKAESVYDGVDSDNITVTNNAGKPDTVYFTMLSSGDTVRVYDSELGGTLLGSATVAGGSTDATVSITQLGKEGGNVYVTVSSTDKSESGRTEVPYLPEASTDPLDSAQIVVTNNIAGTADTIYVSGLNSGDIIKAYSATTQGNLLGSATVPENGTSATITVTQLGSATGSVYVSVTGAGKLESKRTGANYLAEGKSTDPKPDNITVNNNSGAADTVIVTGLTADDVVKVYTAKTGGTLLGSGTVSTYGSEATVTVTQLGTSSGSVYVSVTSSNKSESERIEAKYEDEPTSAQIDSGSITVTNNAGIADTVRVTGLTPGDLVKVYSAESGGNVLGSGTVSASSTEAIVSIPQIGVTSGKVYVTLTSPNKAESLRTAANYEAEGKSTAPEADKVFIANNYGIASTVTVAGLKDKDTVNIYDSTTGGILLGTGTVATYNSEVTITVSQLSEAAGKVYISVTSPGKLESDRTPVDYDAKPASTSVDPSNVTVLNNVGIADTITVTGLDPNTIIKVYSSASGGNPIGTATIAADSSEATINISQLGASAGSIYITITSTGKTESGRTQISYPSEEVSDSLAVGNIKVINNSGMADTITVTGLSENDVVKIYNAPTGGSRLAMATANPDTLKAVINISQLGTDSGSIYVTVTKFGKSESNRTEVTYEAESAAALDTDISIINNAGMPDTITVNHLSENDVIKAYDAASGGNLLGSATVPYGSTSATITVTQLTSAAGKVYISVTNYGRAESSLTKAQYISEQSTIAPYIGDIYILNNADINDTITVYNLTTGDVVKVYDQATGGNLLGYASVANNKTEATVSVEDLGSGSGVVYVSVITKGKTESTRTQVSYVAEGKTTAPYSGNIYVTNNVTIADTVLVSGLTAGDRVKVYNFETGGELLGSATVASGSTQAKISISQLGTEAGSVFVSVTSKGNTESNRTEAEYVSEQTTNDPYAGYITVQNNKAGTPDTITVTELSAGDIIKVYSGAVGDNQLGSATVTTGSTSGVVTITQLGVSSGSVYVTITSPGKYESGRTKVDYVSE